MRLAPTLAQQLSPNRFGSVRKRVIETVAYHPCPGRKGRESSAAVGALQDPRSRPTRGFKSICAEIHSIGKLDRLCREFDDPTAVQLGHLGVLKDAAFWQGIRPDGGD